MKFVSNVGTDRVLDITEPWLKYGHQLDMVSPSFSLFAFAEVLTYLPNLSQARLVIPPRPPFELTLSVQEDLSLLGIPADRVSRNKLQVPWLARKLSAWLEGKVEVRYSRGSIPQGTLVLRDGMGIAQQAILGSFAFSTEGLGITPGNPLSLIQTSESPAEAQMLSHWFDMQWGGLKDQPEAKAALIASVKELSTHRDATSVYTLMLQHLCLQRRRHGRGAHRQIRHRHSQHGGLEEALQVPA
jgi:hypothetical protein